MLKLLICILGILDEQEHSVQSAEQVWSWGNMYLPKHGNCLFVLGVTHICIESSHSLCQIDGSGQVGEFWC